MSDLLNTQDMGIITHISGEQMHVIAVRPSKSVYRTMEQVYLDIVVACNILLPTYKRKPS